MTRLQDLSSNEKKEIVRVYLNNDKNIQKTTRSFRSYPGAPCYSEKIIRAVLEEKNITINKARRLTKTEIEEIVMSHPVYGGDPCLASRKEGKYSADAYITHWKERGLNIIKKYRQSPRTHILKKLEDKTD